MPFLSSKRNRVQFGVHVFIKTLGDINLLNP